MSQGPRSVLNQPAAGEICGQWTLLKRIGRGGNGEVWQANNAEGKTCAIKILAKAKDVAYGRFRDEVKVMSECGVAGVVPIIDCDLPDDCTQDRAWYVMPLGEPLAILLHGAAFSSVIEAVAEIADTMGKLHAKKIFHRDIKPENLISIEGQPSVGDFGLVDYPKKKKFTFVKERLGPRWTMAPEVLRLGSEVAPASADVYSLAKTLWILVTGNSQGFDGQYAADTSASIQPYAEGSFVEPLETLLAAATDHSPEKRPTMIDFCSGLRSWLAMNANYHTRNPLEWAHLQKSLFPVSIPLRATWTDRHEIVRLLDVLGRRSNMNHMFFPNGGGLDLDGASIARREEGCIELNFGGLADLLKPKRLMFESFGFDAEWNYFRLEADDLPPSGVYEENDKYFHEELTDLGDKYVDRGYWDQGEYNGEKLPAGSRVVIRYFKGAFVIFQKSSRYNGVASTYDGRHNKMTADEFRNYIQEIVTALVKRNANKVM